MRGFADAVASGALDLDAFHGLEDAVERLTRLPGIGDWTAQYLAMRALGVPDAFPAGDLGVRQALARGSKLPSERDVRARAERWRPWRAYAVIALWTEPRAAGPLRAARRAPAGRARSSPPRAARTTRPRPTRTPTRDHPRTRITRTAGENRS